MMPEVLCGVLAPDAVVALEHDGRISITQEQGADIWHEGRPTEAVGAVNHSVGRPTAV